MWGKNNLMCDRIHIPPKSIVRFPFWKRTAVKQHYDCSRRAIGGSMKIWYTAPFYNLTEVGCGYLLKKESCERKTEEGWINAALLVRWRSQTWKNAVLVFASRAYCSHQRVCALPSKRNHKDPFLPPSLGSNSGRSTRIERPNRSNRKSGRAVACLRNMFGTVTNIACEPKQSATTEQT